MAEHFTEWFPPEIYPARHGWYQRLYPLKNIAYSYWNGYGWSVGVCDLRDRMFARKLSMTPNFPWRGLAKPPGVDLPDGEKR